MMLISSVLFLFVQIVQNFQIFFPPVATKLEPLDVCVLLLCHKPSCDLFANVHVYTRDVYAKV